MSKCTYLHETILRDIVDVVMDVKNSSSIPGFFSGNSMKSITSRTADLTIVFPVAASTSNGIKPNLMVAKSIERKGVAMLQMLFSAICVADTDNASEYIRQFHTNVDFSTDKLSVDEFIDTLDRYVIEHESAGMIAVDHKIYDAVKEDLKNLSSYIPPIEESAPIGSYVVSTTPLRGTVVSEGYERGRDITTISKNRSDVIRNQLLETDIKKANEMIPTMMMIHFISTATGQPVPIDAVIGVKAKLYPVDSDDIIRHIVSKNKDGNGLVNFVRASTREISFWKDFVFAIDKAKLDALSNSGRGSSSNIWKLLERRAIKSRFKRALGYNNDATAITTLVVSQSEIEVLKKEYNIDFDKPGICKTIMNAYNLMGVAIVDEAMETVKFLFDDESNAFEVMTFDHLERESADGGYKKVVNLITKMAR